MSTKYSEDKDELLPDSLEDKDIRFEIELEHGTVAFNEGGESRRVLTIEEGPFPASSVEYEVVDQLKVMRALKKAVFLTVIAKRLGWVFIDRAGFGVLIHRLGDLISLRSPHFVYDPHLEAFFQVCRNRNIIQNDTFGESFHDYARMELDEREVALRNEFLADVQKVLQSDQFRKVLAGRRKSAKRIRRAFHGIWRRAFAKRARNLIVRVDFEYALNGNPEGFHPLHSPQVPDRFLLEVFLADRDRFINNLRYHQEPGRFAEHLLEWGWKLECGQKRGWHLHAVFFFDASRVKSAWYMAEMLGGLWIRLTDGRGLHFNVQQHAREYQRRFIGEIHRGDKESEAAYMKYVAYISKDDQVPVVKTSPKLQLFGVSRGARHGA